jgi:hypothetical protein
MLANISGSDWGAIATVALAFVTIGGVAGAKGSDAIHRWATRRTKFDVILTAFEGTKPNEMTGEEGADPLLVQLKKFTDGMTTLTNTVNHLSEVQGQDHAVLELLRTGTEK